MFLFYKLNTLVSSYINMQDRISLAYAFLIAAEAHLGQRRASGLHYISHPVEVSCILAKLNIDIDVIIAGLLHDIVEDTNYSIHMITYKYGIKVANLVAGVTKVKHIKSINKASGDSFVRMLLATIKDERVILLKLADRIHNIRTIEFLPIIKQKKIAKQTLEIYAPLANRIGIKDFQRELEYVAFKTLHPFRYKILKERLAACIKNNQSIFEKVLVMFNKHLQPFMKSIPIITGRQKSLYSIYQKMKNKQIPFCEVIDIYAYKIIASSREECYKILGCIHALFQPVNGELRDFIGAPKINGYQALQTNLLGPYGVNIEVQIKTPEMDYMSEYGMAGHWLYKTCDEKNNNFITIRSWFKTITNLKDNIESNNTNSSHLTKSNTIFIFTPNNTIVELPEGSSCIDFAYAVHTEVGDHAIYAFINNRRQSLCHRLKNEDRVKIIKADSNQVNIKWLDLVETKHAKKFITAALKKKGKKYVEQIGKRLLDKFLKTDISIKPYHSKKTVEKFLSYLEYSSIDDLYYYIGIHGYNSITILKDVIEKDTLSEDVIDELYIEDTMKKDLAYCCKPIKYDKVFVSTDTLEIHRQECLNIDISNTMYREIFWKQDMTIVCPANIFLCMNKSPFSISSVTAALAEHSIILLNFQAMPNKDFIYIELVVEVEHTIALSNVINYLSKLPNCLSIGRNPIK